MNKWVEIRTKTLLEGSNTAVCKQVILSYPSPYSNAILDNWDCVYLVMFTSLQTQLRTEEAVYGKMLSALKL